MTESFEGDSGVFSRFMLQGGEICSEELNPPPNLLTRIQAAIPNHGAWIMVQLNAHGCVPTNTDQHYSSIYIFICTLLEHTQHKTSHGGG